MGVTDLLFVVVIAGGALYLLYRSIRKKKGHCCGCGCSGSCERKRP